MSLERILDRMANIRLDEEFHGPEGDRRFNYEPTFILRGLTEIHITFDAVEDVHRRTQPRRQGDAGSHRVDAAVRQRPLSSVRPRR